MAPLPVVTITYENRRTGMYGILVAPGGDDPVWFWGYTR